MWWKAKLKVAIASVNHRLQAKCDIAVRYRDWFVRAAVYAPRDDICGQKL